MTSTLLSTDDTCVGTAGLGMATTWTLAGSTSYYTGAYVGTDGYTVVATMTWQALTAVSVDGSGVATSITANPAVIGTCVETLTDEGTALASGTNTEGNFAICHWMYFTGLSESKGTYLNGTTAAA